MYPRATVDLARRLSELGVIDSENARICGVSIRAIRHWRQAIAVLIGRTQNVVETHLPTVPRRVLDERAYAYLLGLYLGDGHITRGPKRRLRRSGSTCCDGWPGLLDLAKQTMSLVMPSSSVFAVADRSWLHGDQEHVKALAVPACRSMAPAESTSARSNSSPGSRRSWPGIREASPAGSFTPMAAALINHSAAARSRSGDRWYEYPRYLFVNRSADIHRLCGEALDRLGVAWRFSKPTTISVARREAVARLDEFVGPKY